MKKFKFFTCNSRGKIIASSNGYFTEFTKLPEEFNVEDILNNRGFSKTVKKRAPSMREGSKLKISKLCGPEYLYMVCIGENAKIETLREQYDKICSDIDSVNKEIAKLAGSLLDELKKLQKAKDALNKQIKNFEESGVI